MTPLPPPTLAIDFGQRKIGLAISRGTLAEPLKILERGENSQNVINEILELCAAENVVTILVGESEGESAQRSRDFVEELRAASKVWSHPDARLQNITIELVDETLTTREVQQKLAELKKNWRQRNDDDHLAAAVFLQEWLDDWSESQ